LDKSNTIIEGPAGRAILDTMADYGMEGFALWNNLFKQFTANKPLRTIKDFQGLKFRIMPSPILTKMIQSLGGSAIVIDYAEVFTALQTGAIDGQEAGVGSGIYNMKFYEVQKYLMVTNHISSQLMVFGNKKWYEGLNSDTKDFLQKAIAAGTKAFSDVRNAKEEEAYSAIRKYGTEIIELTPAEIQGLSDAVRQPCIDLFLDTNGEKGKAIVEKFDTEIAKLK